MRTRKQTEEYPVLGRLGWASLGQIGRSFGTLQPLTDGADHLKNGVGVFYFKRDWHKTPLRLVIAWLVSWQENATTFSSTVLRLLWLAEVTPDPQSMRLVGAFRDYRITAEYFQAQRQWRNSKISLLKSNLYASRYTIEQIHSNIRRNGAYIAKESQSPLRKKYRPETCSE
jgi:hypothetical protein